MVDPVFPDSLLEIAFRSSSGEIAWPKAAAIEAAAWLAKNRIAVLGGEAWLVEDDGQIRGVLPSRLDERPFVWGWQTEPSKGEAESWDAFCSRPAVQAGAALNRSRVDELLPVGLGGRLRYNLIYCDKARYTQLHRTTK
jgi:hypothetical protein